MPAAVMASAASPNAPSAGQGATLGPLVNFGDDASSARRRNNGALPLRAHAEARPSALNKTPYLPPPASPGVHEPH